MSSSHFCFVIANSVACWQRKWVDSGHQMHTHTDAHTVRFGCVWFCIILLVLLGIILRSRDDGKMSHLLPDGKSHLESCQQQILACICRTYGQNTHTENGTTACGWRFWYCTLGTGGEQRRRKKPRYCKQKQFALVFICSTICLGSFFRVWLILQPNCNVKNSAWNVNLGGNDYEWDRKWSWFTWNLFVLFCFLSITFEVMNWIVFFFFWIMFSLEYGNQYVFCGVNYNI